MSPADAEAAATPDRPGAVQALADLAALATTRVSAVILAEQRPGQPVRISQLQPTEKAVPALSAVAQRASSTSAACEVIDYMPGGLAADGQVMWLSTRAVPLLETVVTDSRDLANLPAFDPRQQRLGDLAFTAMRLQAGETAAVFVQALRGNQVVARSTKLGVLIRAGVLDIPDGDLLMLNGEVTAILVKGYVFFRDRKAFQRLTGLLEELKEQASTTFQTVTSQLGIDGLAEMALAVTGGPSMLGKMASIQEKMNRYPAYKDAMTMPKLLAFVREHPECGVDITGEGDDARFVYQNDPQHRFKILKLLDDDYLRSQLTSLDYEANSKSAPIRAIG